MRRCRFFTAFCLLLTVSASCSSRSASETAPATEPDIRGTVTKVNVSVEPRTVLVEEKPEESAGSPKASVQLTPETRVLKRAAGEVGRAAPEELAVGQTVSVWFSGPVMESYPVQATAATVVIEVPEGQ
jgi:Protein of unknown function (DUF3221)